jgi:WD40 repeat protein
MTDARTNTVSVADRVRPVAAGSAVVGVHVLDGKTAFVLGEESLLLVADDGTEQPVEAHAGGILASAADAERVVTGGDDGKVVVTSADGETATITTDPKHRWIDHVALGPDGAVAWSAGKTAFVRTGKGEERSVEMPSTPGALAFMPKGLRLAVAHYNGVSLWFPNANSEPERLEWKGSHLGITISPDGRFLVTAMQEPALHGWRIVDSHHMRMSGYSARVRSLDWTADGKWLASSGSEQLILWPFQTKDGPMGKQPRMLAPSQARVNVVACNPKQAIAAVGYADGVLLLVRLDDGAEILVKRPGDAPVSALGWEASGAKLAFGTEDGEAGILVL